MAKNKDNRKKTAGEKRKVTMELPINTEENKRYTSQVHLFYPLDLARAITNGISREELCKEYECSWEDLYNRINSFYLNPKDRDKKIRALDDSAKKRHGNKKTAIETKKSISGANVSGANVSETEEMTELEQAKAVRVSLENGLVSYAEKESELRSEMARQTESIKSAEAELVVINENLEDLLTKIAFIERRVNKLDSQKTEAADNISDIKKQLLNIAEERREIDAKIAEINEVIAVLEAIPLNVFNTGVIEPDEPNEELMLNDNGCEELATELFTKEDGACGALTSKEIKVLARIICIVRNSKQRFSLLFDNEKVEKAFYALV